MEGLEHKYQGELSLLWVFRLVLHEENSEVSEESEDLWSDEAEEDNPEPANSLREMGLHSPVKTAVNGQWKLAGTYFDLLGSHLVHHEECGALANHTGSHHDHKHHRHRHVLRQQVGVREEEELSYNF